MKNETLEENKLKTEIMRAKKYFQISILKFLFTGGCPCIRGERGGFQEIYFLMEEGSVWGFMGFLRS